MFYVKADLAEGATVMTEITAENVFTVCPGCGQAHAVDLCELIASGEVDLYSTKVYCPKCSDRVRKED